MRDVDNCDKADWMGIGQRWDGPQDARRLHHLGHGVDYLEPALPTDFSSLPKGAALIAHSSELALATTGSLNGAMLAVLQAQVRRIGSPWAGEHFCLNSSIDTGDLGYNFAPILDDATLEATAHNVRIVQEAYGCTLAIECGPRYFPWCGRWDDHAAIVEIAEETDSFVLLDLSHHICTMLNLGRHPLDGLSERVLARTVEIHVTGIGKHRTPGFYHDCHSLPIPDVVWKALGEVLVQTPQLLGVTLEHDHHVADDDYARDLDRLGEMVSSLRQST